MSFFATIIADTIRSTQLSTGHALPSLFRFFPWLAVRGPGEQYPIVFAESNFIGIIGEVGSQVGGIDVDNRILGVDLNPGGWKPFNGDRHKWSLLFIKSLYVR